MDDFPPIVDNNVIVNNLDRHDGESVLDYTQRIRIAAVSKLTALAMPEDPKDINALNQVLDGIDRQEFNKAKIELDSVGAASDKEALSLITSLINSVGNTNPYESKTPVVRVLEHEGPVVSGVVLVPGELDSVPEKLNYDEFMKEYKRKNPKNMEDDD